MVHSASLSGQECVARSISTLGWRRCRYTTSGRAYYWKERLKQFGLQAIDHQLRIPRRRSCRMREPPGQWGQRGSFRHLPCCALRAPSAYENHNELSSRQSSAPKLFLPLAVSTKEQALTFWMPQLELDKDPGSEQSKSAQEHDEDDARNEAYNRKRRWQREHAIANNLRNHEHCDEFP